MVSLLSTIDPNAIVPLDLTSADLLQLCVDNAIEAHQVAKDLAIQTCKEHLPQIEQVYEFFKEGMTMLK